MKNAYIKSGLKFKRELKGKESKYKRRTALKLCVFFVIAFLI